MFTGIIQSIGTIESIDKKSEGDVSLGIDTGDLDLSDSNPGDSIALNGVCLTAVKLEAQGFVADVSIETLNKTSLAHINNGSRVNLEKALTLNTALGGHLVSGHVDGMATIVGVQKEARSTRYCFELAAELQHYIAEKGSVTIDGTSLTVNQVDGNQFAVNIVPHTAQNTIFGYYQIGTGVNIEVDIIARYLERLITGKAGSKQASDQQLMTSLAKSGFLK